MTRNVRGKITINGGTFTESAVGIGDVRVERAGTASVTELRAVLAAERASLVAAAPDGSKVASAVDALDEELASTEPDGEIVRGAWKRIQKLLDGGASVAGSVAKIGEAVSALFGS